MTTKTYPSDLLLNAPLKFLGATVLSTNCSLGLGTANSTMNINLIVDCDAGDYFAPSLLNTDSRYVQVGDGVFFRLLKPDADPCSFTPDKVLFEFGGILTSWTATKNSSGLTYSVKVDDPKLLFDNVAIIVDSFSDKYTRGGDTIGEKIVDMQTIYKKYNYINVYQYYEGLVHDGNCTVFGDAGILEAAGMPYNYIIKALKEMDMTIYSSTYKPLDETNPDPTTQDRPGEKYYVQWSDLEIPNIPTFFRINGPKISLADLCTQIADLIGAEYYAYLENDPACSTNNLIRIGFIYLTQDPPSFAKLFDEYDQNGTATNLSYGQELRAEKTKTILIGSNVHRVAQYDHMVIPFFGFDEPDLVDGEMPLEMTPIVPIGYDPNGFYINKKVQKLNAQLNVGIGLGPYMIHELDIRAAMASMDAWLDRVFDPTIGLAGTLNFAIRSVFNLCVNNNDKYWQSIIDNIGWNGLDRDAAIRAVIDVLQNPKKAKVESFKPGIIDDLEKIHHYIKSIGDTYYGKQYLIPLTNIIEDPKNSLVICGYRNFYDSITGDWTFNAEPSPEGGWVDFGIPVLGLNDPYLQMFRNPDGRLDAFAKFRGGSCGLLDLSYLSDDDAIVAPNTNEVWVKADVDKEIILLTQQSNYLLDRFIRELKLPWNTENDITVPCALFKFGSPCLQACNGQWVPSQWALTVHAKMKELNQIEEEAVDGANKDQNAEKMIPAALVDYTSLNNRGWQSAAMRPDAVAIPIKYNNQVYGPWGSSGCFNDGGGVEFVQQTDLNPWTYGSLIQMTAVGSGLVSTMNRGLLRSETGSATVVGLPSVGNLGSRLNANGPILSSISINYGSEGVSSTAEFKTYSPKFGTMNKVYLDRFKEYSKQRLEILKKMKDITIMSHKVAKHIQLTRMGINRNSMSRLQAREASLQRVVIGQLNQTYGNEYYQTRTGFETMYKSNAEMVLDYNKKAFMSLDAFFGPVSILGEGNLPGLDTSQTYLNNPVGSDIKSYTKAPQPPSWSGVFGSIESGTYNQNNLSVRSLHLNPVTNPDKLTDRTDGGRHKGHAIDLVGRGDTVPEEGLLNNILPQDDAIKYADDYRLMAMRGPILLHSWGYDTNGKPIPNATTGGPNFAKDWLQKPQDWPVGPIDLRFDKERRVWVSPPAHRIVAAQFDGSGCAAYGEGLAKLLGEPSDPAVINVIDRIGCSHPSGSKVYVYFDTYDGKYIVLTRCSG
jgi:hypothetical protein